MRITNQKIIQVDAFTNKPFQGNPAAVCVLTNAESDKWMQQVAQEMNLSEIFVRKFMDAMHQESIRHQTKVMNPNLTKKEE